uniref:HAT C-terminal dimerisation domain-containing protein n=1 Tax=Romanomermis culicivorax TaxID=13658 RepID=A0A915HKL3_ROMCU
MINCDTISATDRQAIKNQCRSCLVEGARQLLADVCNTSSNIDVKQTDVVEFWLKVHNNTDTAGNSRFMNISTFALNLLSLPFSNASVERAFSAMALSRPKEQPPNSCPKFLQLPPMTTAGPSTLGQTIDQIMAAISDQLQAQQLQGQYENQEHQVTNM